MRCSARCRVHPERDSFSGLKPVLWSRRVDSQRSCALCRRTIGVLDETRTARPDLQVETRFAGDLTGVWDKGRLTQLLANLLGNAATHRTAGTKSWASGEVL